MSHLVLAGFKLTLVEFLADYLGEHEKVRVAVSTGQASRQLAGPPVELAQLTRPATSSTWLDTFAIVVGAKLAPNQR